MRIEVNNIGNVCKSLTVKRAKADDEEIVIATLKFEDLVVDREVMDALCYQPDGWARQAFFDDLGAPRIRLILRLPKKLKLSLTGAIKGVKKGEAIKLTEAELADLEIGLTENSALLSGALTWKVAGDEIEDLEPLLGRTCTIVGAIYDSGQQPLWGASAFKEGALTRQTEIN